VWGDIDGDFKAEVLVLTKRSVRTANHYQVKTWDAVNGYKDVAAPEVRTYRGFVEDDPDMRVNANIELGGLLNANLSDGRNINIRLTTQSVTVTGPEGTSNPGTGNVVVPLKVDRISPTSRGFIVPRHIMRRIQMGAGHQSSWDDIMQSAGSCLGTGTVERMIDHSHVALEAAAPAVVYGTALPPFAMEDGGNTQMDQPLEIDLLENDYDGNGDDIFLEQVDSVTSRGGRVEVVEGGKVRYTPLPGFLGMDEFTYQVSDSDGLTNRHGYAKIFVRNNGLATRIRFDETSGSIARDSGPYRAHGLLTDGLCFCHSESGQLDSALERTVEDGVAASADFEGVGDPMDGSLSVSLWVKYRQAPTEEGILICKGGTVIKSRFDNPRGGWFIGHTATGGFRFAGNLQRDLWQNTEKFDRESNAPIKAETWYHLVMVIDRPNQVIRAWVNNEEILNSNWTSFVPDGLINSSHSPLVIFSSEEQQDQGEWFGPVTIDEIQIYNNVLTSEDVALLNDVVLDSDNDELPDHWEFLNFGTIEMVNATRNNDGDGATDLDEYIARTDPKLNSEYLRTHLVQQNPSSRELIWQSIPGVSYQIEYS